ncbi:hypothetical protein FRC11_005976, partial [Ceratobasidium sp. 423]
PYSVCCNPSDASPSTPRYPPSAPNPLTTEGIKTNEHRGINGSVCCGTWYPSPRHGEPVGLLTPRTTKAAPPNSEGTVMITTEETMTAGEIGRSSHAGRMARSRTNVTTGAPDKETGVLMGHAIEATAGGGIAHHSSELLTDEADGTVTDDWR